MTQLGWWMRIVGAFYLLQFVMMVFVRAPIRAIGPAGALGLAAGGDPMAMFVVETWVIFGLEVGAIGAGLLLASRRPAQNKGVVWTVIAVELARGLAADLYHFVTRGDKQTVIAAWIVIHTVLIVTGLAALRTAQPAERTAAVPALG